MRKIFAILALLLMPFAAKAEVTTYAPLVKKTSPSVVNIYTKRVVQERVSPFGNDPFFNQFFNAPQFGGAVRNRIENSLGSGVVVDDNGTIATNNHVIRDATEISVVTSDGREFPAEKVLADARTDLAILKVKEKLPAITLADSDAVEVGDVVLAIGNPFGVGQTVTSGIVSAVARTDVGISDYSFFIQTDAAINPGNSGGALVDMNGRLIGINSAIFSKDGGSLGIGFAIPVNMVKVILENAKHGGKVVRPWTGLTGQAVTADMLEGLKLDKMRGALINRVAKGSPAERAGVKVGDVVLSINGKAVSDPNALKFRLATVEIGGKISLEVWRGGKASTVEMTAEKAPETVAREETLIEGQNPLSGAVVANISPALTDEIGALPKDDGVVVLRTQGGLAARLGLRRGDLVLSINGKGIDTVSDLKKALKAQQPRWAIQLQRGEQVLNLTIN